MAGEPSPRTGSAGTGRARPRRSWPPSWRRSPSGCPAARRTRTAGADLIAHYLDPTGCRCEDRWSRKHADTQRRLCQRLAAPVIGTVTCQDIEAWHTQQIVNAAPTAGEGARAARMLSALVAGIEGGYLTSPRLAKVHWQAGDRRCPPRG